MTCAFVEFDVLRVVSPLTDEIARRSGSSFRQSIARRVRISSALARVSSSLPWSAGWMIAMYAPTFGPYYR